MSVPGLRFIIIDDIVSTYGRTVPLGPWEARPLGDRWAVIAITRPGCIVCECPDKDTATLIATMVTVIDGSLRGESCASGILGMIDAARNVNGSASTRKPS